MSTKALTSKRITVADLPDSPRGQLLKCFKCAGEYSACRGDYFLLPSDHVFTCCRRAMELVIKQAVYREVA